MHAALPVHTEYLHTTQCMSALPTCDLLQTNIWLASDSAKNIVNFPTHEYV